MIAPPTAGSGNFNSIVVAWNGSFQAARALEYAMPFLEKASKVTLLVVGSKPDDVGASYLARNLAPRRHQRRRSTRSIPAPCRAAPAAARCSATPTTRAPTCW